MSELFSLFSSFVLRHLGDELICQFSSYLATPDFKQSVHVLNVPVLIRGKAFTQVGNLLNEIFARTGLNWCIFKVEEKTFNYCFNVLLVGHLVQQVQRFHFQGVVGILETVHNKGLV